MDSIFQWTTLLLPPLTGIVAWVAGRRQRTRDNLEALQGTLDKLRTSIAILEAKIDSITKAKEYKPFPKEETNPFKK